jgi:hypothetical protein
MLSFEAFDVDGPFLADVLGEFKGVFLFVLHGLDLFLALEEQLFVEEL